MNTSVEDWDEIRFLVELFQKLFVQCPKEKQTFNVRPCISASSFVEYERFVKC